jgi:hypothetical protein
MMNLGDGLGLDGYMNNGWMDERMDGWMDDNPKLTSLFCV